MTNEKWTLEPWSGLPSRDIVDGNGERVARVPCVDSAGNVSLNGEKVLALPGLIAALEDIRDFVNSAGHTDAEVVEKMRRRASDALALMWRQS